ncbi:hypothetical protein R5O87_09685 [Arthrobacter globiformis]|uniref:hypothetical protein n=1 Tax=Arthrobacter globiformis TaxID=1665 RepID=UPI00397C85B2
MMTFLRLPACTAAGSAPFRRRQVPTAVLAAFLTAGTLLVHAQGAAADAVPGSDWGAQGSMASDSAVTVNWDNSGNPAGTVVPRDAAQQLPHTAGKTYADVGARLRSEAAATFGAGNGLGGLAVTVSQTRNLQNQAVTVSFSGAKAVAGSNGKTSTYLQVFQCWGAPGPDGKPDPDAASPDPATCQFGATGSDGDISNPAHQRALLNDPLVRGGDWEAADRKSPSMNLPAPFLAIDGQTTRITDGFNLSEYRNPYFSRTSTNEQSNFISADTGSDKVAAAGSRTFEIQTGAEASGLGCGFRPDAPSVSKCWLVAVPRTEVIDSILNAGPLTPSLWATRVQVPLYFQDVAAVCPSDQAATLSFGSESLASAMKSWIPGICDRQHFTLGFSPMSDLQARSQLAGGRSLAFTTRPLAGRKDMIYAPAAVSGVVVAMTIDNVCTRRFTAYSAADCGYANEAEFEADKARNGSLVRNLRLNARLVAKLLTQSYALHTAPASAADAPFAKPGNTRYGRPMTYSLQQDPEFLKLNPTGLGSAGNLAPPVVEGLRSDAASAVWDWLLHNQSARAFLQGCPDPDGMVINPFYSMRTYDSCEDRAAELDAAAKQKIAETKTPASFTYAAPAYPSDSAPYPQAYWAEKPAVMLADGKTVDQPALTVGDQFARVPDMATAAQNTVRAQPASVTDWCADCSPPAFKSVPRQGFGSRSVISITDAASAARFQLPTAQLCSSDGTACVAANNASLQAAAGAFEPTGTAGVVGPDSTPDYASGAYPLTVPVYGVVNSAAVTAADARTYARLFDYIGTAGQEQGFRSGTLPPGYAPLTAALKAQTAAAAGTLRSLSKEGSAPVAGAKPVSPLARILPSAVSSVPEHLAAPATGSESAAPAAGGEAAAAPAGKTPQAGDAPVQEIVPVAGSQTARTGSAWPQHLLLLGFGLAAAAAIASLILSRGKRR